MAKQYKACENISILHHNNPIRARKGQRHSPASPYILHAEEQQNGVKDEGKTEKVGKTIAERGKKAK